MIGVIIVAEDECDGEVRIFKTQKEADAFCEGVSAGAGLYGCGDCSAYTRADLESLNPNDENDARHIEYINKYLPDEVV